jgi:DNA replicative helicase MCM subunit Mcm2 (Cdc46/Mcm family)
MESFDLSSIQSRPKSELKLLINTLKKNIAEKNPNINKIRYPKLLLVSLNELHSMIGMKRLKESIALQIMRLIESLNEGKKSKSMLNTILYGPPGVGKTKVGMILAKIWYSLGYLAPPPLQPSDPFQSQANIRISNNNTDLIIIGIVFLACFFSYITQAIQIAYKNIGLYWLLGIIFGMVLIGGLIYY